MRRKVSLEEISDGKLYTAGDMAKADCQGCDGCSACCRGMGSSIILDPLDVFRLQKGLDQKASELFENGFLEWNVVDGIILPNLVMGLDSEACVFLDRAGRCSIHAWRPGICRMFPLGRYYREDPEAAGIPQAKDFRYFLQVHECPRKTRTKVKIRKWIDTDNLAAYEAYILSWHNLLQQAEEWIRRVLETDPGQEKAQKKVNLYLMNLFYMKEWNLGLDFYPQYETRWKEAKEIFVY